MTGRLLCGISIVDLSNGLKNLESMSSMTGLNDRSQEHNLFVFVPHYISFILKTMNELYIVTYIQCILKDGSWFITSKIYYEEISRLASCQWGPATAHWVGILTEMYVIRECSKSLQNEHPNVIRRLLLQMLQTGTN